MFNGFTKDAVDFLTDIRLQNNQAFYEANKERYERVLKTPLRALCEEMAPAVQLIDPRLDVRAGRVVSRLRRDTRFSADKSPFRDHAWLSWRYPGDRHSEGFSLYWGFGPDWVDWGCGCYGINKPLMDALRLHIRREPDAVRAALNHPELQAHFEIYGEAYKKLTVPEDVPDDLRALYVKKGFGLARKTTQADWTMLFSPDMADVLAHDLALLAQLHRLMQQMRAQAEAAQAEITRENALRAAKAQDAPQSTGKVTVRSAEEFEF